MASLLKLTVARWAAGLIVSVTICSGCGDSISEPGHTALVRVINASTNAQAINASYGTMPFVLNQGPNTFSYYAPLTPGQVTVSISSVSNPQNTVQTGHNFLAAQEYSVFVTNNGLGYQATILNDQSTAPPAGYFAVRLLQQASKAGNVDIYLLPSGATLANTNPLLTAVSPGTASSYINVPSGPYAIVIFPTGTKLPQGNPVVYTSASTQFSDGQARTILIVDQQVVKTPAVNAVIGSDWN